MPQGPTGHELGETAVSPSLDQQDQPVKPLRQSVSSHTDVARATAAHAERIDNVHTVLYGHPNVLALLMTGTGLTPNANRITAEAINLLGEMGLSGQDLVVCHQMLESHTVGTHLFDLGGSPYHLQGRRMRLRAVDHPVLDRHYPDDATVDVVNRKAFAASIEALLDYCESRASGGAKPRTSRAPRPSTR